MSITVLEQPSAINVTGTKLVYRVSSSIAGSPQFQYVTNITSGSQILSTINTYPQPTSGEGIIEVSQLLADHLEYTNDWKITGSVLADNRAFKAFSIQFSESFGTSISSSVTVQGGGVNANGTIAVFPGTIDSNLGTFDYSPRDVPKLLTNQTQGYIAKDNHLTVSFLDVPDSFGEYEDLYIEYRDAGFNILYENSCSLELAAEGNSWVIYNTAIGSGSSNFGNAFDTTDWEYIYVYQSGSNEISTTFNRVRECKDGITTFAFINDYGFYDYYSTPNPVRKTVNIDRQTMEKPIVGYSYLDSIYSQTRRGQEQYRTSYDDQLEVTTDYLDKETADWLAELLHSPQVYIQESGSFYPIVITNPEFTRNTFQSRQKLYQLTIQFKYANQRYDR